MKRLQSQPNEMPDFIRRFRERAGAAAVLPFAEFMALALYDEELGYYRRSRERVGRRPDADFYTAATLDRVFGPLTAAAALNLLGPKVRPEEIAWVEIGAEPGRAIIDSVPAHPFGSVHTLRLGDELRLPPRAIVVSNELFDAQPFARLVWRDGSWRELGVATTQNHLAWAELETFSADIQRHAGELPAEANEGYVLDVPVGAAALMETIAASEWTGLLVAYDYGRTWNELTTEYPAGTGRAFAGHRASADLLANPGEQDLTCHVCWDWLEQSLQRNGFTGIRRSSQETFFISRASAEMERLIADDANPLSPTRSQLRQLLHPALMGQKFEVLHATRGLA